MVLRKAVTSVWKSAGYWAEQQDGELVEKLALIAAVDLVEPKEFLSV